MPPVSRRSRGAKVTIWLGLSDLFQTFEDLESVVDKEAEIANIRELLDEGKLQHDKTVRGVLDLECQVCRREVCRQHQK